MRKIMSFSAPMVAAAMCLAAIPARAQDPVAVNPKIAKVDLENEQARVLRVHYGGHEMLGMHEHPARVVVLLTGAHSRATFPDGTTREFHGKAGDVVWAGPGKHSVENLSDVPMETIEIELKNSSSAPRPPVELDPVKVDPKHHHVEFQNDRVRVIRGTVGPHEKTPWHDHPARVEVWLSDADVKITLPNGTTQEIARKAGQVTWSLPARHLVENLTERPLEVIVVELQPAPASSQGRAAPLASTVELLTPTGGVDFSSYLAEALATVKRNWYALIPAAATEGTRGRVVVEFQITRNGTVVALSLAQSSGSQPLDRGAQAAIRSSSPFAPLPESFPGQFIELRLKFLYNLPAEHP